MEAVVCSTPTSTIIGVLESTLPSKVITCYWERLRQVVCFCVMCHEAVECRCPKPRRAGLLALTAALWCISLFAPRFSDLSLFLFRQGRAPLNLFGVVFGSVLARPLCRSTAVSWQPQSFGDKSTSLCTLLPPWLMWRQQFSATHGSM